MKSLFLSVAFVILVSGCNSNDKWDLSQARDKDGYVYRINKQSGEVDLLIGLQAVRVEGTQNSGTQKDHVIDRKTWGSFEFESLAKSQGKIAVQLKTDWHDNNMYYIFTVQRTADKNADNYLKQLQNSSPNGQFLISLFDRAGFRLFQIPIKMSAMSSSLSMMRFGDELGGGQSVGVVAGSIEINQNTVCGLDTYNRLRFWSVSADGFTQ